jgi:hypothetical protein
MGPAWHQGPLNSTADRHRRHPVQRGNDINSAIPGEAGRLGGVDWAFEAVEALADGSALRQVLRPDWTQ